MAMEHDASPRQVEGQATEELILSNNETTREFVNVVCKDTDLLLISNRVQQSVREVCLCLGLEEPETKEIEGRDCDNSIKIYSALMSWSEKLSERKMCTWGELTQQFASFNDPTILETVKDYLITCPPRKGQGIHYYSEHCH